MAAAIAQTIAVVDKSGKVVGTGKQLKNVFMEAKYAYQERKAEIVAERKAKSTRKADGDLRRAVTHLRIEDNASERSSTSRTHHHHHSHRSHHGSMRQSRPDASRRRRYSSSSVGGPAKDSARSPGSPSSARSHPRSPVSESSPFAPTFSSTASTPGKPDHRQRSLDLVRRRTDMDVVPRSSPTLPRDSLHRSASLTAIDMDLAYGEYHPSSIAPPAARDDNELLTLVDRAKLLLDEANCAQHSVKAMIEHLQKNPDAMAAVALTLAEISNIASKMAPGALTALKGSAPAVFALLASPQFLIAAGVGIGVTVVMLGGYKVIKKIKAKNVAKGQEGSVAEMIEIDGDEINRINKWRRGIVPAGEAGEADMVGSDAGTSVEGEFITPLAASMRGMETREDLRDDDDGMSEKERKKRRSKAEKERKKENKRATVAAQKKKKSQSRAGASEMGSSQVSGRASSSSSTVKNGGEEGDEGRRALVKVKKPSPLRRLLAS